MNENLNPNSSTTSLEAQVELPKGNRRLMNLLAVAQAMGVPVGQLMTYRPQRQAFHRAHDLGLRSGRVHRQEEPTYYAIYKHRFTGQRRCFYKRGQEYPAALPKGVRAVLYDPEQGDKWLRNADIEP